jgi:hypothetical protein
MARNRRSDESSATRLAPALMALLACAFFVSTGFGYLWYNDQNNRLGKEIVRLEHILSDWQTRNDMARNSYESMTSPMELNSRVEQLNREHNLGLGRPDLSQIVRISEPAASRPQTRNPQTRNPQRPPASGGFTPEKP